MDRYNYILQLKGEEPIVLFGGSQEIAKDRLLKDSDTQEKEVASEKKPSLILLEALKDEWVSLK